MSFYTLNTSRHLEMTSSQKGLTAGLSIAAALILAVLALCAYRRHQRMNTPPQEEEKEIAVVTQEETSQESSQEEENVEVALTESKSSELSYDKSISMCRSGTMNSLDVHTCQSGSCDLCRKNQEPNFLGVKKVVNDADKGRIRSLPDRWWENPLGYLSAAKQPEVMQTIVSMSSKSGGSEWGESVYDDEASHEEEESLHLEDGVVRD